MGTHEFLTYPKNKVIALLDDTDSVRRALSDLVRAGFDKEGIDVLFGPGGAAQLNMDGRQHGFKARVYRLVERMGDTSEWLQRHASHIARGGFGVTVPADKTRKTQAAEILQRHGAHDAAYFGQGHWESL